MSDISSRPLELLAPARDAATAMAAIEAGADAVYIGPQTHGARAAAGNSLADIARVVERARLFGVRVYATVNTLVYPDEVTSVEKLVRDLYRIGVDALIVQDMSLLRMSLPPIALHASTQCDIRDASKARFLADVGFSRVVIARETTLEETAGIVEALEGKAEVEAFVHGALCVSYSGDCQASLVATGRSANRGECAQMCRLAYDLVDGEGKVIVRDKHLLSLRDLNRLTLLPQMVEAGVSSFKIEGRLKDASYVATVTAAYSRRLNDIIAASGGRYRRASIGRSVVPFDPDPSRVFNRGFTSYFTTPRPLGPLTQPATPKAIGPEVGRVVSCRGRELRVNLNTPLANGDGLGYFDTQGRYCGFRVNKVEEERINTHSPLKIAPGTHLYRNFDKAYTDTVASARIRRCIEVRLRLRLGGARPVLEAVDETGLQVTVASPEPLAPAQKERPEGYAASVLSKSGATVYSVKMVKDEVPTNLYLPPSLLADLRRRALELLDSTRRICYRYERRLPENAEAALENPPKGYHLNVANPLAQRFWEEHGVEVTRESLETKPLRKGEEMRVMTTRFCLRRELGACLREPGARKLKGPLWLRSAGRPMRLDFDCKNCRMHVMLAENY